MRPQVAIAAQLVFAALGLMGVAMLNRPAALIALAVLGLTAVERNS